MHEDEIIESLVPRNFLARIAAMVFLGLGVLGTSIMALIIGYRDTDVSQLWAPPLAPEELPLLLPLGFSLLFVVIGGFALYGSTAERRKLQRLVRTGTKKKATIISSTQDFSRTVNRAPLRVIELQAQDGSVYTFKSYDLGNVPTLTANKVVPIICNDRGDVIPDPAHFEKGSSTGVRPESYNETFAQKAAESGDQHFRNKNYHGAVDAYRMALEKHESPELLEKLARAYDSLGQTKKAKRARSGRW